MSGNRRLERRLNRPIGSPRSVWRRPNAIFATVAVSSRRLSRLLRDLYLANLSSLRRQLPKYPCIQASRPSPRTSALSERGRRSSLRHLDPPRHRRRREAASIAPLAPLVTRSTVANGCMAPSISWMNSIFNLIAQLLKRRLEVSGSSDTTQQAFEVHQRLSALQPLGLPQASLVSKPVGDGSRGACRGIYRLLVAGLDEVLLGSSGS